MDTITLTPILDDGDEAAPPGLDALLGPALSAWVDQQGTLLTLKDADSGAWVHVNDAMACWLQCSAAALRRQGEAALDVLLPVALRVAEQQALQLAPGQSLRGEHRFEWRGAHQDFSVWRHMLQAPDGRRLLCSLWTDQAPRRREQERLRDALAQLEEQQRLNDELHRRGAEAGLFDAASGLHPYAFFETQLAQELARCQEEMHDVTLVWVAPDRPAGQALDAAAQAGVQAALARLLRHNTRAQDVTCRLDEGRFAVLMSGVGLAVAYGRMQQLRRQCATHIVVHGGRELGFTVSMGVASCPHTAQERDALVAACEAALALAQRGGGDQVALARIPFQAER